MLFRTVACNPAESFAAYRRAEELLTRDAPAALRAEVLIGLAWTEASAGDPVHSVLLLAEAEALAPEPDDVTVAEMENARLMATIRLGRFAECEAVAQRAGSAIERLLRPDLAYPVWINAASALACAGDLAAALRCADRGIAATRGAPVVALPCLAARAHLLARLGRHDEAAGTVAELLATAERLDSAPMLATARHDAGLVALAGGRHCEAAKLLVAALDADAAVSRPAARLALAEALALDGAAADAGAELRRAVLEPVGPGDQAWALVPRMARVQGLVARARGDADEARRRLAESAEGLAAPRRHHQPAGGGGVHGEPGRPGPPAGRRAGGARPGAGPGHGRAGRAGGGRMPEFTLTARAAAPVEEVWKLLFDPTRFPEWWAGIETVQVESPQAYTIWLDSDPEFPMPQQLRTDTRAGRVTMSCQVSDIDFSWQLAEAPDGTEITARATVPPHEGDRLAYVREMVSASLGALTALVEADPDGAGRLRG